MCNHLVGYWVENALAKTVTLITEVDLMKYKMAGLTESEFFRIFNRCAFCGKKVKK